MTLHDERLQEARQHEQRTSYIARLLAPYYGKRLLGVVDSLDWTEIVFSDEGDGPNLLSLKIENGVLERADGGVAEPEEYVSICGVK
ncbi:MAG TPA: hypothetical protein VL371_15860 [Gemmataceae bacterium]|nr:hypothetical protein [Gemmataceae bacterium]